MRHDEAMRILVVEDEPLLAAAVAEGLRRSAYAVDVVHDEGSALERIEVNDYDVVVLDRDLPVVHGDDVCRAIAAREIPPRVLMLTAAAEIDDRVDGLALGADDYLPKPFAFRELSARVAALGRRSRAAAPPVLQRAGIRLDTHRREVFRDGRYVPLSRKEFAVLAELLRADGVAVSAEQLIEKAKAQAAEAPTSGNPVLLERLVQNLVENGVRHNISGGWVHVSTASGPSGQMVLQVSNTGPVVPRYEVPALFEPSYRLGSDRLATASGVGLGLSIVRAVAQAHGGVVEAEPREGGGLVVTVTLPAA